MKLSVLQRIAPFEVWGLGLQVGSFAVPGVGLKAWSEGMSLAFLGQKLGIDWGQGGVGFRDRISGVGTRI